jgi:HEAT repeat protein
MNPDESNRINREKRGQVSPEDLKPYFESSDEYLMGLLKGNNPQKRTISAKILGRRKTSNAIIPLSLALKSEKALYSRIAISESLSSIGEPAVVPLIGLLGEIGHNQETELPKTYFNKKSFPLSRDMAARTLVKIGKPATNPLIAVLENQDKFKVQQAIDALGGIAAKNGDRRALKVLINRLELLSNDLQDNNDKITLWKITRALSGFKKCEEAIGPLLCVAEGDYDYPIVWESLRSLSQIEIKTQEIIDTFQMFKDNENSEIRKAAKNALSTIDL